MTGVPFDAAAAAVFSATNGHAHNYIPHPDDLATAPEVRSVRLTPASAIPMKVIHWAWDTAPCGTEPQRREGRIAAGSLAMVAGRAGIGKSQIACWLSARVTRGTLPGCWWGQPRAVIYAAAEDSWAMTIVPRLAAAGADLDRVYRVEVVDSHDRELTLTLPLDEGRLEDAITEHDVAVVVMDPMLSLLASTVDDYRAKEVRGALEPLVRMADRTGAVLFAVAHFNKGGTSGDPMALLAGSSAFGQLVRACLAIVPAERDEDDPDAQPLFVMSTIKNNLGRTDLPSLEYRMEAVAVPMGLETGHIARIAFTGRAAPRSVADLLRRSDGGEDGDGERDEAAAWLRAFLETCTGCEAARADVVRAGRGQGFSESALKRARVRLKITTESSGYPARSTWKLPVGPQLGQLGQSRAGDPTGPTGLTGATESDVSGVGKSEWESSW